MPLTLERVSVIRANGLPRITAYNENHDELGRFAEGDGPGGFTKADHHSLMKEIDSAPLAAVNEKIVRAMEKISQGTTKQVIGFAKEIGIAGVKSKREALAEIRSRYESRWENALNTRFHATAVVCAAGLPRIVGYNENHDELGRFAETDSAGGIPRDKSGNVNPDAAKYPHLAHLLNGASVASTGHTKREAKQIVTDMRNKGQFASAFKDTQTGKYLIAVPANSGGTA